MKLGISSYSLLNVLKPMEMDILGVIEWVADQGGEHIEIVPLGFNLVECPGLIKEMVQKAKENPGSGWFQSSNGNYLRGAIVGHGDIDIQEVLKVVKSSGYDGFLSIEFEGMEACKTGTKIGLDNVRKIWDEL